jgi:hypothetical protein
MTIEMIHVGYLLDTPDEDILARVENVHRNGIVNLKTVRRWTSKFRSGETDLVDELKPSDGAETKNYRQ